MFRTHPKYRRLEMMIKDDIPTQSEIRNRMGSSMAKVLFEYCHPQSKDLLGVMPPLKGPRDELWISPSDQLIQKVALVPPLTNKCIKACTHQGILAIGEQALENYERDLYNNMIKKNEEQRGETRNMFEAEKRRAIQLAEQELRLEYENFIETLRNDFQQKLQTALAEAFEKCNKSMQKAVIKERVEVTRMMLKKLRDEISYVITSIYGSFEQSFRIQKENMIADFNEIIRREDAKMNKKIKEMERQKEEALRLQRHELEMENFANVTYVLCLERMRSSSEKHAVHLYFEKQIEVLKKFLIEANNTVHSTKTKTADKKTNENLWENKLVEVVREFQKFINFAFKAVPGQADFLLSLESLLTPESDDKLHERNVPEKNKAGSVQIEPNSLQTETNPQLEIVKIIDSCGKEWIPMQLIPDFPKLCCTEDQLISPILKSEIDLCSDKDYINKTRKGSSVSLNSYSSLPFCCLDDVLYVRSDYHEKNEVEIKKASQLAEGSQFIMQLKHQKNICTPKITDSISSLNIMKKSTSNVSKNTAADTSTATVAGCTEFKKPYKKSYCAEPSVSDISLTKCTLKTILTKMI